MKDAEFLWIHDFFLCKVLDLSYWVGVHVCLCTCTQGPEVTHNVIPQDISFLFSEVESLIGRCSHKDSADQTSERCYDRCVPPYTPLNVAYEDRTPKSSYLCGKCFTNVPSPRITS